MHPRRQQSHRCGPECWPVRGADHLLRRHQRHEDRTGGGLGPVLSIIEFDTEEDATRIGNDIAYGLVAGVWTQNIGRAMRMTKALKVGTVWVNTYRAYSFMMPFGGTKKSGLGRESGIEAINEYLETKSVFLSTATEGPTNPFIMR